MSIQSPSLWNSHHQLAIDLVSGDSKRDEIEIQALLGRCPVCLHEGRTHLIELPGVPILCHRLWNDKASARNAKRGSIQLVICEQCGNIYNKLFDPGPIQYDENYNNSLSYSAEHRKYLEKLSRDLVKRFRLTTGLVIEIGCGGGFLLRYMAEQFGVKAVGFDPGTTNRLEHFESGGSVQLIKGFFASAKGLAPSNLVICRHLLEHLPAPWALLQQIRNRHQSNRSRIYIEVPNGDRILSPTGLWDLIYEHVSHFTMNSLLYLMGSQGFRVLDCGTSYGEQYIWLIAESGHSSVRLSTEDGAIDVGSLDHLKVLAECGKLLHRWGAEWNRVGLWGAGSKGITFANLLDPSAEILSLFDINPNKWNRYISRTGHRIRPPSEIRSVDPTIVLVMNPLYMREVSQIVGELSPTARVIDAAQLMSEIPENQHSDRIGQLQSQN
jgi:SAM-dependent methyltransferase